MVVAEVSLSMVLLVGAGLFVSSLLRLRQVPLGFDPHRLLTLRVSLRGSGIDGSTEKRTIPDASGLLERVRALPGVRSAEIASALPFLGVEDVGFAIDGRVEPALGLEPTAAIRAVTPGYFAALGIPVERGRAFSSGDTRASPPVVLVNRNLARHYFGQENPLGHGLRIMSIPEGGSFRTGVYEIVGIAGNSKEVGLDEVEFDAIYVPLSQSPVREAYLAVRSEPDAPDLAAALKREAAFVDPERPAYDVVPMEQIISRSLSENRLYMMLALAFASVAVLLAAAGLSGVLSYAVAERRGEIAVRMALGAESSSVLAMISEDSGRLLATGVAIGLGLALALGRLLKGTLYLAPNEHEGLIYGVSVNDPWLLLAAALLLFFLAALASYLPARRATRVDLVTALREG
jgi:putative ABC transport system permease protein